MAKHGYRILAMAAAVLLQIHVLSGLFPASAAPEGKTDIMIYTWPLGTFAYAHNYALAEKINKESTWLRAQIVSSNTPTEGIMSIEQNKAKTIACVGTDGPAAIKGIVPYKRPMTSIKSIGSMATVVNPFAATTPIKSWAELKGKTVTSTSPAAASVYVIRAAFERAGVKPNEYKIAYMTYQKGADSLKSKMVGACSIGGSYFPSKQLYMPNPATAELLASQPTYFVPVEKEDVAKVITENQLFGLDYFSLPAGSLKGSDQPISGYSLSTGFYCDESMDSRIVTEFLTIFLKYYDELKGGIPALQYLDKKDMGYVMIPVEYWHPAAVKFMKENQITIR